MSSAVVHSHTESVAEQQPTIFLFTDLTTDTPSSTFLFADYTTAKVNAWRRYKSRMHMRRAAANRPPTSFDRTQQTRTSPKAASTKEGRPFPGHEMLDIRRPDPCIAQCKLLYRSAVSIVNTVTGMFALDRTLLGGRAGWIIVNACIIAMASMATMVQASETESGADWVVDMQRSVLMLIAAFILTDTIMVATTGPELHQRAVRMDNEELAVARWAPRKEL